MVERAAMQDFFAATNAKRRKETYYRDRAAGTKFVPFALETYGLETLSLSLLCTWFRQRVSIALQRSLAHAIHTRTLRLEQSMALLL